MKVDRKRYLDFFKKLAAILLVANLTSQTFSATFTNKLTTPNIIVIYTDDQGMVTQRVSIRTANSGNIDRLAQEGPLLIVTARIRCVHHRYGLLTGIQLANGIKTRVFQAENFIQSR